MDNVWEDVRCPLCGGEINMFGFCDDCGYDYEQISEQDY